MNQRTYIIKILMVYLTFTYIFFLFGRYIWYIPSYFKLTVFVILSYLAFYFGFKLNLAKHRLKYTNKIKLRNQEFNLSKSLILFRFSSLLLVFFQLSWIIVVFGKIEIFNLISQIGVNYYQRLNMNIESSVIVMQIRTLLWGLTLFSYPLGFYLYKDMRISDKIILVLTIFIDIITSLNMGISKNIGDIVLIFVASILIGVVKIPKIKISRYKKQVYSKILIASIFFLFMFYIIQTLRYSNTNLSYQSNLNPFYKFSYLRELTFYDFLFFNFKPFTNLIDKIGAYFSHGYAGLGYALELPFINTYGIGFSRALIEYFNQYLNINVMQNTYNERIQFIYNWNNGIYWPTALVWWGNILSMWFVPIILYFFGSFTSRVLNRFILFYDVISLTLFCQIFIGIIYLPANNQLFQSRSSLFGTSLLIIIFFISERRKHAKINIK